MRMIPHQTENINEEIDIVKENRLEILEPKSKINEMKNSEGLKHI